MKRWMLFLAALLLPALAWAAPETPYAPETAPRYALLSEAQQTLLDTFYAAAARGEARIDLPEGTPYDDAAAALSLLTLDYPELAGLSPEYALGYYQHAPETAVWAELRYTGGREEVLLLRETLLREAQAVAAEAAAPDAYSRTLALHDALCARAAYDLSAPHAHDAYGALAEGRAACEGYAQAMTLLCRLSGVPCTMVTGMAWDGTYMQPHAWNLFQPGGGWLHMDATYDDQQTTLRWYFGLTEEQLRADHQWDGQPALPGGEGGEYHLRAGFAAFSMAEAEALLARGMAEGGVSVRFYDEAAWTAFCADPAAMIRRAAEQAGHTGLSYSVMLGEQQRCALVQFD